MKITNSTLLLVLVLLLGASCRSSKTVLPYFQDLPATEGQLATLPYEPRIQPDDELFITISSSDNQATATFNRPEVNPATRALLTTSNTPRMLTYFVSPEGTIDMPIIGRIHAEGLTTAQLCEQITEKVRSYVRDPRVTVELVNFTVVVAGEVKNPSTVRIDRNRFSILEALSAAGDMTEYGERSNLLIIRENNGERTYARLNLNSAEVLNSPYYYLQPNDYIYVSPNNVRQENSKYNQNNGFKLSVISTAVSACSVVASLIIALAVK